MGIPTFPNIRVEGEPHDGVGDGEVPTIYNLRIEGLPTDEVGGIRDNVVASDSSDSLQPEQLSRSKVWYGSARSTLLYLYYSCGRVMAEYFQEELGKFMKRNKRNIAPQKEAE